MTTPETLVRELVEIFPDTPRTLLDIGASDGTSNSNTYGLLRDGWTGVSIECDPIKAQNARQRYAGLKCEVVESKATPMTIVSLLKERINEIGFLSLDIDGYDLQVLKAMLAGGFIPKVVCSEINPSVPPPIKFAVAYSDHYAWGVNDFYGHSISALDEVMMMWGYRMYRILGDNAVYVRGQHHPEDAIREYFDGFFRNEDYKESHHEYYRAMAREVMNAKTHKDGIAAICKRWDAYDGQFRVWV